MRLFLAEREEPRTSLLPEANAARVDLPAPTSAVPPVVSDLPVSVTTSQLTSQSSSSSSPTTSLAPSRLEQDASRLLSMKSSQPDSNVSRFFPGGKNDISLTPSVAQPPINRDAQTPSSFDPPRQSRLLAFGAQSRNTAQTALPSQQGASSGIGLTRTPENVSFANAPEGLEASILSRQSVEPSWATSRTTSSPSFAQSFAQPVGTDRSSIIGQHALNSTIPNTENFSRLQNQELSQLLLNDNTTLRSNFGMEALRDQFGVPNHTRPPISDSRSTSISLSGNERVMGFVSPSEGLHQLEGRGRNGTPPAAPFGSTSPISPYDGQVQPALSVGKGSRMAKHFERVNREVPTPNGMARVQMNQGMGIPGREQQVNTPPGAGQARNIADLLTMLSNSAQVRSFLRFLV